MTLADLYSYKKPKKKKNKEDLGQKSKETRGMPHPNSVPVHLKMQNLEMDRT